MAVDGDGVVVVEIDQLAQLEEARDGGGFGANAFHEVAVGAEGVGVVVDDGEAGLVEALGQPALGERHTDAVAEALAERAGGGFDAGGMAVFGVARRPGAPLAEVLQVVQGHVVAGEVEGGVEEHRGVARGEDKAVAVGPLGITRVVAHDLGIEEVGKRGVGHGGAGVARIGLLHTVHGEGADGVDAS